MANIISVLVYKKNQADPIPLASVGAFGFPATFAGLVAGDCSQDTASRSLTTGVNVYSFIQDQSGNKYYCRETLAQLITLFG